MITIRSVINNISLKKSPQDIKYMSINLKSRLLGKVAVCTASTEGIGFAIAKRLAQEGAKVVVSSRRKDNVDKAVQLLQQEGFAVIGSACHVSNAEERKALYESAYNTFGGIDILISNAGTNPSQTNYIMDCTEEEWDKIFALNLKSCFMLGKEIVPYFEKRGGGTILYNSSICGVTQFDILGAYSVSKAALISLSKTAAQSLGKKNITVNCIAPGVIKTKFVDTLLESADIRRYIKLVSALKRYGTVDDVSGVAAFLVSDDASYITGETIAISGGVISSI